MTVGGLDEDPYHDVTAAPHVDCPQRKTTTKGQHITTNQGATHVAIEQATKQVSITRLGKGIFRSHITHIEENKTCKTAMHAHTR